MRMDARQRQPTVRLQRIDVFQEKYRRLRRLSLGLAAQPAILRSHCIRLAGIASAVAHIAAQEYRESQNARQFGESHSTFIIRGGTGGPAYAPSLLDPYLRFDMRQYA